MARVRTKQQHYRFLRLLEAFETQKTMDREAVRQTTDVYKQAASVTVALSKLSNYGFLRKKKTGKKYTYTITPAGSHLLDMTPKGRIRSLKRQETATDSLRRCCVCDATKNLTAFKKALWCPTHLNPPSKPEHGIRRKSMLALIV